MLLNRLCVQISPWLRIVITRSVALVPALVVAVLTRNNESSTALDELNQWLNLLQSVQLPFALIPVLAFNASETLMGKFANSKGMIGLTVLISLLVMLINVSGVLAFAEAALFGAGLQAWLVVAGLMALYLLVVGYIFIHATAAAGLLPACLGWVAERPGGQDGDSFGGGRFRRVPSRASTPGLAALAAEEGSRQGVGVVEDDVEGGGSLLEGGAGAARHASPAGVALDEDAEAGSAAGGAVAVAGHAEQLRQPLLAGLPVSSAAWRSSDE